MDNHGGEVSTEVLGPVVFIIYVLTIAPIIYLVKVKLNKKKSSGSLDNLERTTSKDVKSYDGKKAIRDIGYKRNIELNSQPNQIPIGKKSAVVRQEYRTAIQDIYAVNQKTENIFRIQDD